MVLDPREERRRNIKALTIVLAILLVLGAFAYRPATVIGVHGEALAHSLGGIDLLDHPTCVEHGDGEWRCEIPDSSGAVPYAVHTHGPFGCWEAVRLDRPRDAAARTLSGCISGFDVLGPL